MRRKKRDFEKEIAEINEKIKKAEAKVKALKETRKEILKDRDAEVHQALAAAMAEKNLKIADVLKLVNDAPAVETNDSKPAEKKAPGKKAKASRKK